MDVARPSPRSPDLTGDPHDVKTPGVLEGKILPLTVSAGSPSVPGLDLDLADSVWDRIDDQHPQAALRALLARAQPLPPPPPEVTGDRIELRVPIQFFLR